MSDTENMLRRLAEYADDYDADSYPQLNAVLSDAAAHIRSQQAEIERLRALTTPGPRVRHVKRGTEYEVLGEEELQASTRTPVEGDILTSYRDATGKKWVRLSAEFNDGQFVPLPAPPQDGETS